MASKRRNIPDDVTFGFLLLLPVKTLCRFQCVSKSWSAMISDPLFHEAQYRRSQRNPRLLSMYNFASEFFSLDREGTLITKFKFPYAKGTHLRLSDTCLQLVCMYNEKDVYICNPTRQEFSVLPRKSSRGISGYLRRAVGVGFGYVPSTKEFKAIRLSRSRCCDVFTIGTDRRRWRIAEASPFQVTFGKRNSISANGAIHICDGLGVEGIARFDLEHEKWSVLSLPPAVNQARSTLHQLRGLLCIMERMDSSKDVAIWLLKDYDNNVWVNQYKITLPIGVWHLYPLAIEEDGRILTKTLKDRGGVGLHSFAPDGKCCGETKYPVPEKIKVWGGEPLVTVFYVESFLSLRQ